MLTFKQFCKIEENKKEKIKRPKAKHGLDSRAIVPNIENEVPSNNRGGPGLEGSVAFDAYGYDGFNTAIQF